MSAFRVGQNVVCVKRESWRLSDDGSAPPDDRFPAYGRIYTIDRILPPQEFTGDGEGLILAGLDPFDCWAALWFRPVAYPRQSLEHDVAKFKRIARHIPAPSKESVE